MNAPKPTPAQLALLHVAESGAVSAVATVIAGVYQIVATHGLDWPALGTFAGTIFLGSLAMIYKSVLANPNLAQATSDTLAEIRAMLIQTLPYLHSHPTPTPPVQPPDPHPQPTQAPMIATPPVSPQGDIQPHITLPSNVVPFTMPVAAVQTPQVPPDGGQ